MPNDHGKDPWSGKNKPDGPPDLDKVLKDLFVKLHRVFGQTKSNNPYTPPTKKPVSSKRGGFLALLIILAILILWFIAGFFIVDPASQAVILRLGKYSKTLNAGLHWIPKGIDTKYIVNTQRITPYQYSADMLTQDENIVNVTLVVHYRINNPRDYLFNVVNANESLRQATASALRQTIGSTPLDDILTTGRLVVRERVTKLLRETLDSYKVGLEITDVVLQPAKPPEEVTEAFNDAIQAREDEQRYIKKAQAYESGVVPIAQGKATRILQQAKAYKEQIILKAKGETAGFNAMLSVYEKSPLVVKNQLYFGTLESIFEKNKRVLIDTQDANNLIYLPLQKLFDASKVQTIEKDKSSKTDESIEGVNTASMPSDGDEGANLAMQRPTRDFYDRAKESDDDN